MTDQSQLAKLKRDNKALELELKKIKLELRRHIETAAERSERIQGVVDNVVNGIITFDEAGIIETYNPAAKSLFGYSVDETVGKNFEMLIPQSEKVSDEGKPRIFMEGNTGKITVGGPREVIALNKDGYPFPVELSISEMPVGERRLFIAVLVSLHERKQVEAQLMKLSRAVEYSSSAVSITDSSHRIEYVNPRFTDITGYSSEEAIGKRTSELLTTNADDLNYADLRKTVETGADWKGELRNCRKDGSFYWARYSVSAVKDAIGAITHYIGIQDDVTQEIELKEALNFQVSHDALTGIINRIEFERRTERIISNLRRKESQHAMCYMDLDQFKIINDTCGHVAGDELLRQLSKVLQETVRSTDTLARLGGDEFGLLMEDCSLEQAQRVATALQQAIEKFHFSWAGQSFRVGLSIGLVAITRAIPNLTELLKLADAACYMAKDLGRNRVHVYSPNDIELAQRHGEMQWVTRINKALDDDRFCLYAQKIISLKGGTDDHHELLLRMIDEKGEIVPPGAFLPSAERYGLIGQLDGWVTNHAFELLSEHPEFVESVRFISINLSGQSLSDEAFLKSIIAQFTEKGIEPGKICFEITETVAISNLSAATTFISSLKKLGCRFALDDFGSGLSSFGYLKNLPVDYLKIDGMFVKDIFDDPIDHAMVKSINDIGHVMGMKTIAEFVENDEIKAMLGKIGVDFAQGYGIGKPLPFDQLLDRVEPEAESAEPAVEAGSSVRA